MTISIRGPLCARCRKRPEWSQQLRLCAACFHCLKATGGLDEWRLTGPTVLRDGLSHTAEFERELREWLAA